jgi:hypothetical protein
LLILVGNAGCDTPPTPEKDAPPLAASAAAPAATVAAAANADDVLSDCPGKDEAACGAIERGASDQKHFGHAFELKTRESLSAATTRLGDASPGETVQISGTVDAVCQKKGCWMVLKDGDQSARVFTHAGNFFLPLDTNKGRKAVVEGMLKPKAVTEKFAKHLAEDKGDDPSTVSGDTREWVLDATSLELL